MTKLTLIKTLDQTKAIPVPGVLAECNNGKSYPVSVKFSFGQWCVSIECGMGAWGSWSLASARDFNDCVYIQAPDFYCKNMRAVVAHATAAFNEAQGVEGECA